MQVTIRASLHPAQTVVHSDPARFRVVNAGRRWGKTRLGVLECLDVAVHGGRAWWIAPSYKIARVGWRPAHSIARRIPGASIHLAEMMIALPGGGEIAVRSADNPDSLRGEGLDFVVMDECAQIKPEAWSEAVRPALSDRLGRALFIGTPKGRNWFWDVYQRGLNGENDYSSHTYPTEANPFIAESEIEAARRELPELIFRQEYMAEFIDSNGGVFRMVRDAIRGTRVECAVPGRQYIAGVDVASAFDYTVVCVMDVQDKSLVYMDRFNRVDYGVLLDRLAAVSERFSLDAMVVESNSIGQPVIDMLAARGIPVQAFTTTNVTKTAIIQGLQAAFENGLISIIDEPVLITELLSYEARRTASGVMSYSAPEGMHDDCVMSLAIAWDAIKQPDLILFGV